jgi:two-component system nitrogen regulation response regulator GlnG/two-component system response regulator HydG
VSRQASDESETADRRGDARPGPRAQERVFALAVLWCEAEPERVGEVLLVPPSSRLVFGRAGDDAAEAVLRPVRQRPGSNERMPLFRDRLLSRKQLVVSSDGDGLRVSSHGRRALVASGVETTDARVREGDLVEIRDVVLFMCITRPLELPLPRHGGVDGDHAFGTPDRNGIVGESEAAWKLREAIAFVAPKRAHVLLTGESGTGKELVARAIHALSPRGAKKIVARNAATLPSGLVDAELFGNVAGYPHAGMPERPGLVGEAEGGTLFLDEIGELGPELQTHLLRLLDDGADYQRLGEARRRVADVRVVAATNRPIADLRSDLAARLALRVEVPGLDARREDIALLLCDQLRRAARDDADVQRRFFATHGGRTSPRVASGLVAALAVHDYGTHVRELAGVMWRALAESTGDVVALTDGAARELHTGAREAAPSADEIRAALERHAGVQAKAWKELGLPNRFALRRLMKTYGIKARDSE